MTLIELVGGIWCGARVRATSPSHWVWVDATPNPRGRPQCYPSPGPGRIPYRCIEERRDKEFFLYAGDSHCACPGCGAVHALYDGEHQRVDTCTLCGHELAR